MHWLGLLFVYNLFAGPRIKTLVADRAGIFAFLKQEQGWQRLEIYAEDIPLSPDPFKVFVRYASTTACGHGVCPQYLFMQTERSRWRLIGTVSGLLTIDKDVHNGLFAIHVQSGVGDRPEENITIKYEYDGDHYVEMP